MKQSATRGVLIGGLLLSLTACGSGGVSKAQTCKDFRAATAKNMAQMNQAVTEWGNGKAAPASGGVQPLIDTLKPIESRASDQPVKQALSSDIAALAKFQTGLVAPASTASGVQAQQDDGTAATNSLAAVNSICG